MSIDKDMSADKHDLNDLTPEEARRKLEHFLAITEENTRVDEGNFVKSIRPTQQWLP